MDKAGKYYTLNKFWPQFYHKYRNLFNCRVHCIQIYLNSTNPAKKSGQKQTRVLPEVDGNQKQVVTMKLSEGHNSKIVENHFTTLTDA